MMKQLLIPLALLAPISAYAADPCTKSELECLNQIYMERLIQVELINLQAEAHTRYLAAHSTTPAPTPEDK